MNRDYREGHRIGEGASEGDGMLESSRVELEEKREPKRVAFSCLNQYYICMIRKGTFIVFLFINALHYPKFK